HRRALIAADIAHAGLQQRLGHGEDALAVEGLALAELERLHLFFERAFHRHRLRARRFYIGAEANATGTTATCGALFDGDIRLANDAGVVVDHPLQVGAELRAAD